MFLSNLNITNYLIIASTGLSLISIIFCFVLYKKLKSALYKENKNIPESIIAIKTDIRDLATFQMEMEKYLKNVEKRLQKSIQSAELIRFNPFEGSGSGNNQSFSLSFVNEKGDGIVLSGLYYSNDRVSMFVKPINTYSSKHELTDEEKEVLNRSKESIQNNR